MSTEKILKLWKEKGDLNVKITHEMKRTFPVGSTFILNKWGGSIRAKVLRHDNWTHRMFVESETGKEYWITLHDAVSC